MRKYKTTGNTTLFDKEDTERKANKKRHKDTVPRGAHLRVHGEHDAQAVHQDGRLGAGDGGDRADQFDVQQSRYEQIVRLNLLKD